MLRRRLPAQFGVRPEPDELERVVVRLAVDQHQIGSDVAVAMVLLLASQSVVAVVSGQRRICRQ